MKRKIKILSLCLAAIMSLSACTGETQGQEIPNLTEETESTLTETELTLYEKENTRITFINGENKLFSFNMSEDFKNLEIGKNYIISTEKALDNTNIKQSEEIKKLETSKNQEPLSPIFDIKDSMTLEEKVGQIFYVRCPLENAKQDIKDYHLGGYILFAVNFEDKTKDQVISEINDYQKTSEIPMLIGVDEEGGIVNRVSKFKTFRNEPFMSPKDLYDKGGFELIKSDTEEKCRLLGSLGINLNFAPVADVPADPSDYMYPRAFGGSPQDTAQYVRTVVDVMEQNGIGSVLKHFPGYGSNVNTHTGIAIDERSLESFRQNDFLPFESGIEAGAPVILVSHNIINAVDSSRPASLSPAVHDILREELGFSGLIITDDLYMDAISQYTQGQEAAVMAVIAGNDLLCCTDYETQYPAVVQAVRNGRISESRIDQSVARILLTKKMMGIM